MKLKVNATPDKSLSKQGFTLVELLVVVAIVAVIGAGVAVTYGGKTVDASKDQMTLHEMQEIKKAFLRFHSDNFQRLHREFADHDGNDLPSSDFRNSLDTYGGSDAEKRFYGQMDFYEQYGLWFLMMPKIAGLTPDPVHPVEGYKLFPDFDTDYDVVAGNGWNGPYLDVTARKSWVFNVTGQRANGSFEGDEFPQIADKHEGANRNAPIPLGVYRILYYEHEDDNGTVYRRLLLISPRGNTLRDELSGTGGDELLLETGNRRGGDDEGRLNLSTGAFENRYDLSNSSFEDVDESDEFFILELLNMDRF